MSTHLMLAWLMWAVVGAGLAVVGMRWSWESAPALAPWIALGTVAAGALKSRVVLDGVARKVVERIELSRDIPGWLETIHPSSARLSTGTGDLTDDDNPCLLPPQAGYKGLENQLYRVQVHDGGPLGTATFKWSRDNAVVASRIGAMPSGNEIVVDSLGRDDVLSFHEGDWVEITDDHRDLMGLPGEILVEIGLEIQKRAGLENLFIVTICNDAIGYVCHSAAYDEGGYESGTGTNLAKGAGEIMVEQALTLISRVKSDK